MIEMSVGSERSIMWEPHVFANGYYAVGEMRRTMREGAADAHYLRELQEISDDNEKKYICPMGSIRCSEMWANDEPKWCAQCRMLAAKHRHAQRHAEKVGGVDGGT